MNRQNANHAPLEARSFLALTTVLGALALGHSAWVCFQQFDPRWFYLLALTLLASCFPVTVSAFRMQRQSWSVTIADVFVFAGILVFGPEVGVVLAAAEGVCSSLRVRVQTLGKALFNVAQLAVAAWFAGHVFILLSGVVARETANPLLDFWLTLLFVAVVASIYFLSNSAMVATALHLTTGKPLLGIWSRNLVCAIPSFLINGSAAAVIFVLIRNADAFLGGVIVSAILITQFGFALWFKRRADSLSAS